MTGLWLILSAVVLQELNTAERYRCHYVFDRKAVLLYSALFFPTGDETLVFSIAGGRITGPHNALV